MDTGNNWDQNKWNQDNGNGSGQNNGWNQGNNGYSQQPGTSFITAAYVLGVLSIVTTFLCTVYLPYIFGSLSIIFALLSKGNAARTAQRAASGIRCAILGMIMNTALIIACFTLVFTNPQIHEELNEMTRQIYGHSFDEIMQDIEKGESPDLTQGTGSFN